MKRIGKIGAAILLSLVTIACGSKHGQIRMATGGVTGTYYEYGSEIVKILTEKTAISISIHSTGASKENIKLIETGKVELAIVQNDVMDYAWRGVDLFAGEKSTGFISMAALYAEPCQVVANPASGINTIADLKGKRVAVGHAGSGIEINARQILDAYGVTFSDIAKHNLDFPASGEALKDGHIDAFFCVAGAPTHAIEDLVASYDIVFLEIDDPHALVLMRDYPFYTQFTVPSGSYGGQHKELKTLAVKATIIASPKLSEDTVYRLTTALFENKAGIEAAHEKGKELSASYAVEGISVPFHPGAARYFREIGALR